MSAGDRPSAEHCPQCGHLGAYERSFCPVQHPAPRTSGSWPETADPMVGARVHLYSALIQCAASDDRIIREHVRKSYALLGGDLADLDARNPGGAL